MAFLRRYMDVKTKFDVFVAECYPSHDALPQDVRRIRVVLDAVWETYMIECERTTSLRTWEALTRAQISEWFRANHASLPTAFRVPPGQRFSRQGVDAMNAAKGSVIPFFEDIANASK